MSLMNTQNWVFQQDTNADGSPNLMIISKFAEIKGTQKEDNENGVVKVFLPPKCWGNRRYSFKRCKGIIMDKEKLKTIISDYKNQPNKELVLAMDY